MQRGSAGTLGHRAHHTMQNVALSSTMHCSCGKQLPNYQPEYECHQGTVAPEGSIWRRLRGPRQGHLPLVSAPRRPKHRCAVDGTSTGLRSSFVDMAVPQFWAPKRGLGTKPTSHVWPFFPAQKGNGTQQERRDHMWIRIHKKLRVDTYKNCRRSSKNGETRKGGGARH